MKRLSNRYFIFIFLLLMLVGTLPLFSEAAVNPIAEEYSSDNKRVEQPIFPEDGPEEINYWKEFSKMMVMLGLILAVVLLLAWFLKIFLNNRIKQVNESNIIKVLERRNLSQKSMMYLIEVYNRQFLIGDSASGGVHFLLECTDDIPPQMPAPSPILKPSKQTFIDILQRKLTEKKLKANPLKK